MSYFTCEPGLPFSEEFENHKRALANYESKFEQEFPTFEYLELSSGNGYDFSIAGYQRLADFMNECAAKNEPVLISEGYFDRVY
ncbi:hypothetical protein [Lactovum odontotermitis]